MSSDKEDNSKFKKLTKFIKASSESLKCNGNISNFEPESFFSAQFEIDYFLHSHMRQGSTIKSTYF